MSDVNPANSNTENLGEKLNKSSISIDNNTISIEDYIKASVSAGDRVRKLLYVLSFACAIAFMAYWNSNDDGWISKRYNYIQEVEEKALDTDKNAYLSNIKCKYDTVKLDSFLTERGINSGSKVKDYEKIFRDLKENTYKINVPILGINFDINDLSIFSGGTFLFLLFLLSASIGREKENLDFTFQFAVDNKILNKIYIYLTMGQVLSYPPKPFTDDLTKRTLRHTVVFFMKRNVSKLFYLVPCVVQYLIISYDIGTDYYADSLNPALSKHEDMLAEILLILIFLSSLVCIYRSYVIDKLWDKYFTKSDLDKPKEDM